MGNGPSYQGPLPSPQDFRDIPGCPGYKVNCRGEVLGQRGAILSQTTTSTGYKKLTFWRNGERLKDARVHRLVLLTFVGPCPEGLDCCRHLDGNPANNRLDNLAWGTFSHNERDKLFHGTMGRNKLDPQQVVQMRKARSRGASLRELSEKYGVHNSTVSAICTFRTWKHPVKVLESVSTQLGEEDGSMAGAPSGASGPIPVPPHPERAEV